VRRSGGAVALTLVTLAGCAAPAGSWGEWTRAGIDVSVQRRDEYECRRQAVLRRATETETAALFAACMRARGYQRVGS
jgi:hypothetical protein